MLSGRDISDAAKEEEEKRRGDKRRRMRSLEDKGMWEIAEL